MRIRAGVWKTVISVGRWRQKIGFRENVKGIRLQSHMSQQIHFQTATSAGKKAECPHTRDRMENPAHGSGLMSSFVLWAHFAFRRAGAPPEGDPLSSAGKNRATMGLSTPAKTGQICQGSPDWMRPVNHTHRNASCSHA